MTPVWLKKKKISPNITLWGWTLTGLVPNLATIYSVFILLVTIDICPYYTLLIYPHLPISSGPHLKS